MKVDKSLYAVVAKYVSGELSLCELQDWITSRMGLWESYDKDSPENEMTGDIMLAYYELGNGHRTEESVYEIARDLVRKFEPEPSRPA